MVKISSNVTGYLAKAAGGAGLLLVAYDSHVAGKIEGSRNEKNSRAGSLTKHYMNDMKSDTPSIVKTGVKKGIFRYFADENLSSFFNNVGGYLKGFTSMLVQNVVPLGLAVGTVVTNGKMSKGFGIGLAVYGGIFLLQEAFGIGKSHH